MALPGFNEQGDLPEGRHLAAFVEVLARFGVGMPQRVAVTDRLRRILQLAASRSNSSWLIGRENETAAGEELWRFGHDSERSGTDSDP